MDFMDWSNIDQNIDMLYEAVVLDSILFEPMRELNIEPGIQYDSIIYSTPNTELGILSQNNLFTTISSGDDIISPGLNIPMVTFLGIQNEPTLNTVNAETQTDIDINDLNELIRYIDDIREISWVSIDQIIEPVILEPMEDIFFEEDVVYLNCSDMQEIDII